MIRLGTVGTSNICRFFIGGANLTKEFVLSAVYSRNFDTGFEFAKEHNCNKVYTDLEEMAKSSDIDAVYIASPNSLHYEQSKVFLENGKHVICEKPIVTKLSEYEELKELADSKKLIYMEAIIPRHHKERKNIISALDDIGDIRMARIDFNQRSSRLDNFLNGEKVNIFDMSLKAGTLMDIGVYCVYAAVDLFGIPNSIISSANFFENGADSTGQAIFNYGDFSAILTYGKNGQGVIGSEIIGDKGAVKIPYISQYAGATIVKDGEEKNLTNVYSKQEIMSFEAQRFADYILRFKDNKEDYEEISSLCTDVHYCMDKIKEKANIKYN